MTADWYDRLVEEIERSGIPKRKLSEGIGGVNYIQQVVKDRKEMGIEKFIKLVEKLGASSALYVIFGFRMDPQTAEFFNLAAGIHDEKLRTAALKYLENLRDLSDSREPQNDNLG